MIHILNQLSSTSGRNDKTQILSSLTGPELDTFKSVAVLTYSPEIDFYVKKYTRSNIHTGSKSLNQVLSELNVLSNRILTGNAAIQFLQACDEVLSEDDAEVLHRIIQRDLKCGINKKTINDIWPELIYEHPYMRCSSFNSKNLSNIKLPAYSQTKEDGLYIDVIVDNGKVTHRTRNGSFIQLSEANRDAHLIRYADNHVLQGEAVVLSEDGTSYLDRKTGNGYLNSDSIDTSRVVFVLWDMIPLADYKKKTCKIKYQNRLIELTKVVDNSLGLVMIDTEVVTSIDEIIKHFQDNVADGKEGTVIKNFNGYWKPGTSKDQVKCKIEFEMELVVVDKKEGTGKNVGRLGALTCESSDGLVKVSVGSGFSDEQRDEFWNTDMNGKVVTVKANDLIQNQNTLEVWSLFLPRFIEVRNDKSEADSLDRIKEQRDAFANSLSAINL